jgi:competence protein ComEA
MIKKAILTLSVLSMTTLFGMSLSQLNSASKEDLMKINGIGEAKAVAIIKERKKGKFKSFEDLQRVKGVGPQVASNIKNDVKVGDKVAKVKKSATSKKAISKKTSVKKPSIKKVDNKKLKTKTKSTKQKVKTLKTKAKDTKSKVKKIKH